MDSTRHQLIVPKMENPLDFEAWVLDDQDIFNQISELPPVESLFEPLNLPPFVPYDKSFNGFKNNNEVINNDNIFSESYLDSWYNQANAIDTKPVINPSIHPSYTLNLDNNVIKSELLHEVSMMLVQGDCASSPSMREEEEVRKMSGRKRTVGLELEEIQRHFNMPITQAAREMKVGLTVLKKRCRELRIMRWPHRKIKSLTSLINNVKEMGLSEYEAIMLEEHRRLIEELPDLELTERTKKLRQACFKANYKKRRLSAAYS